LFSVRGNGTSWFNGGNVGIGTTSPSNGIWIEGADGTETQIQMYSLNGSVFHVKNAATKATIGYASSQNRSVNFTNTGAGNISVGIGTDSPLTELEVVGTARMDTGITESIHYVGTGVEHWGDGGTGMSFPANDVISFKTTSSDRLYINSTGNVGIGTTSPGTKLHVGTGSGATVDTGYQLAVDSAGIAGIQILAATNQSSRVVFGDSDDNDVGMLRYDHTDNSMRFITNGSGSERMRINSSGNVGIGTTSPGAKLDVNVTGNNTALKLTRDAGVNGVFDIDFDGANTNFNSLYAYTFQTGNTERMRITSGGNVGIGTTSPQASLQVGSITSSVYNLATSKADFIDGNKDLSDIQMGTLNVTSTSKRSSSPFNQGYGPSITFAQNGSGYVDGYEKVIGGIKTEIKNASNQNIASVMQFYAHNNTALAPKMTIDGATGNVGIGTTSPGANLEVAKGSEGLYLKVGGDNALNGRGLTFSSSSNNGSVGALHTINATSVSGAISLNTAGVSRLFLDRLGNVGIGTTSPAYKLDVAGEVRANNLFRTTDGTNIGLFGSSVFASNVIGIGSSNAVPLVLGTAATERMRIDSAGNVGIGTTTPRSALDVTGTTGLTWNAATLDSSGLVTIGTRGTGGSLFINTPSINTDWSAGLGVDGSYSSNISTVNIKAFGPKLASGALQGSNLTFSTTYETTLSERMRIDRNGNVGIGTISPNSKLDVNGDVFINSNYTASNVAANDLTIGKTTTGDHGLTIVTGPTYTGSIYFGDSGNNDAGIIKYQHSNNSMQFVTNRSEAMRIDTSGNVMIGNTNASAKLDIRQDTGYAFRTENASGYTFRVEADTGNIEAAGSIQMADDTDAASAAKVGTLKYRVSGNNSYVDMCMQTGAATYEWVNIVQNNW
jgi:hypothetical protein